MRQCKVGELCLSAAASRQFICALLAQLAAKEYTPQGSDTHRINDRIKSVTEWRQTAFSRTASNSFPEMPHGDKVH